MAGGAEDFAVLAHVQLLEGFAGGAEIFARVEFFGLVVEDLTNGGGHGETAIAVDIDLADGALRGFAELVFADTDGVFQFAAVLVDDLHEILRDGAGAVEDDREAGDALFDFVEDVQADLRIVAG